MVTSNEMRNVRATLTIAILIMVLVVGGVIVTQWQILQTNESLSAENAELKERIEEALDGAEDLVSANLPELVFYPDGIRATPIDRETVGISAAVCFPANVQRVGMSTAIRYTFPDRDEEGQGPEWARFNSYPVASVIEFGGDDGVPLNTENCAIFEGVATAFPEDLVEDLQTIADQPVEMIIRYSVTVQDETVPGQPRRGRRVIESSNVFTVPAA